MAVSRVLSRGRTLLPRIFTSSSTARVTYSAITSIRAPLLRQNFSLSIPARDDAVQTPSSGLNVAPPGSISARSIALMNIERRLAKVDIEKVLQSKGFNVYVITYLGYDAALRLPRHGFTFQNNTRCFVELESEEEAARAVQELKGNEELGKKKKTMVLPLRADFIWDLGERPRQDNDPPYDTRFISDEGNSAHEAARPLIEGRRYMLSVQTPGWTQDKTRIQTQNAYRIIQQNFDKYGIESIGKISPFYGDKKATPRLLCFLDFKTKEGAEDAARNHHNTEIAGRLTWLRVSKPVAWRAHQIGRASSKTLADLQEKNVAPTEVYEDKFINPIRK